MKYFYDLEFIEDGTTIDLISIGIVAEDGREYYAVNEGADDGAIYARIRRHAWLMENVVPHLPIDRGTYRPVPEGPKGIAIGRFRLDAEHLDVKPRWQIAKEVRDFLLATERPIELWAYYGAYDHVCLMWLWGAMIAHPAGLPMWTHDIMQLAEQRSVEPQWLPTQEGVAHNALDDARNVRAMYRHLVGDANV